MQNVYILRAILSPHLLYAARGGHTVHTMRTNMDCPATCDHKPTTVIVIHAEGGGCRIRCLRCGWEGPERESPERAWRAMLEGATVEESGKDAGATPPARSTPGTKLSVT